MSKLGVIGGLGPMATAYFLELITKMTDAACDQEHLDTLIFSLPSIPDRTAFILGRSTESPAPIIIEAARELERLGVSCIAVPCITSHYFYEEFTSSVSVPWINLVEETAAHLKENGVKKAGILATEGTIATGLFQRALEKQGIAWEIPDEAGQADVTHLIYQNVKAGLPPECDRFERVRGRMQALGCECVILGCTELSFIKRDYPLGGNVLDALEVLARASILGCQKPLKESYRSLLTNAGTGRW